MRSSLPNLTRRLLLSRSSTSSSSVKYGQRHGQDRYLKESLNSFGTKSNASHLESTNCSTQTKIDFLDTKRVQHLSSKILKKSFHSTSTAHYSPTFSNTSSSSTAEAPTTFSHEKMEKDKRYRASSPVPETVLESMQKSMEENVTFSPGFSIKGEAVDGRAAYLDFQATTPMDPRVVDAMLPYMMGSFGNPHSKTHSYGWEAENAVETAREQVANLIGGTGKEIIFTSGATESNNLAIKGVAHFYKEKKNHIITTQIEHKCVLDSCRILEMEGFKVTYLPVGTNGLIDLKELEECLTPQTSLVSIMAVNNEIGVLQPLKEIGELCRKNKTFFHSDIAQMIGKMELDVDDLKIDLASISGHKLYGPKGVGALYVRRKPRVRLEPIINGGGQERGLRSGTLPHNLCVGLGAACQIAQEELPYDKEWITHLSNRLYNGIMENIPEVILNGDKEQRYNGNLNFSFAYVEGESLLMAIKNLAVSSGSACTSASLEPSYVLRAIGVGEDLAHTSIRFGIGRFTTEEEIDFTIELLTKHVTRLREMSPLWELVQEGVDLSTIQWTQDAHH